MWPVGSGIDVFGFNFDRQVKVSNKELDAITSLVRELPCTTQRCRNARDGGRITCTRCEALDKLEGLERGPV